MLETAAAGGGLALGREGRIEPYLASGRLVAVGEGLADFADRCYCVLTEKGRGKALARKCLEFFEQAPPAVAG